MTAPLDDAAFVEGIAALSAWYFGNKSDTLLISVEDRDRLVALARCGLQLAKDISEDMACLPSCDSFAHDRDKYDPKYCQACRAERAEARVRTLEETLQRYGRHWESCPGDHPAYCECGLTAALARRMP